MALFSDVLLTSDFDRTLTAPDGAIPARNLEAIRFFMAEGGAFTINSGRSLPMIAPFLEQVPINAPVLLYNGAAAYDCATGTFPILHPIRLPQGPLLRRFIELCPDAIVEVQGVDCHYSFAPNDLWQAVYESAGFPWQICTPESDMGPFLKISVCSIAGEDLRALFEGTPSLIAQTDDYEQLLRETFPELAVLRSTQVILDIQTGGTSKGLAARELARHLGRSKLVCVGDERNDIAMLEEADYPFCPSDGKLADQYPNVCPCAQGSVADVIYEKIPEILGFSLDKPGVLC